MRAELKKQSSNLTRKRKAHSAFVTETHDILGKALVLRTQASGKVYQLRMWVEGEKKYYRKSLKTKDLETALKRGEEEVFRIYGEIHSGKRIFGITLGQLVDVYLDWRQKEDVETGNITQGRLVTIKCGLKHLVAFKGADTKLSDLEKQSCYNYAEFRRQNVKSVRDVTIRNEEATINHMMKFAFREKYNTHFETFEFRKTRLRNEEVGRRDVFSLSEYDQLVLYMRKWTSKRQVQDDNQLRERLMVRDCFLIASNTMLRVGELWSLKWGDIISYKETLDDLNKSVTLVTLKVRAETAKTRKERLITVRGGEYFKRLYQRTSFKEKDDFIFCGSDGKSKFSRKRWYACWEELMRGIKIDHKDRNLTWYSCRHFGITCRLRAGASVFDVAKIAGTGVAFIQDHYGHFDQQMSINASLKNFSYSKDGIIVE